MILRKIKIILNTNIKNLYLYIYFFPIIATVMMLDVKLSFKKDYILELFSLKFSSDLF